MYRMIESVLLASLVICCTFTPIASSSDCYNQKCIGTDTNKTVITCDQRSNFCSINKTTGIPTCNSTAPGIAVNCTLTTELDEFYCSANLTTGAAICVYPPKHDCYDTKCHGTGSFNASSIICDQSTNRCALNDDGSPLCVNTTRGNGTDCDKSDEFYCSNNATTGTAVCVVPPKHDCYDIKCHGTGSFNASSIPCDQSTNRCVLNGTGSPSCVNTTRGHGTDCDKSDEFYCSNNVTTGTAVCVVPPKHDCYDTKCHGTGRFNASSIPCDQSTNRCVLNDDGSASCVNTTRGNGTDCDKSDDYYCTNNKSGAAVCVVPPRHTCYNSKCAGTGNHSAEYIICDQAHNRCETNSTGYPVCVNNTHTHRGYGVNCTYISSLDYYCKHAENGTAQCAYTPPQTCYNSVCSGKGAYHNITIPCNQATNRCDYNISGYPVCANTSRGYGVQCPHTSDLDYYCNMTEGIAACAYTWKSDCIASRCKGANTTIPCNLTTHRCDVDRAGMPLCVNTSRGLGVNCTQGKVFHCAQDQFNAVASCVYKTNTTYQCYNNKCSGKLLYTNTTIGCDQTHAYCSANIAGFPLCVKSDVFSGDGVPCNGSFTCKYQDSGLAVCHGHGKAAVWAIVVGVIMGVVLVVIVLFGVKKCLSDRNAPDRQQLFN